MGANVRSQKSAALLELLRPENKNLRDVAEAAQVTERQVRRWLQEPAFRRELAEAQRALKVDGLRRLTALQAKAIDALDGLLEDEQGALRLRAAQAILNARSMLEDSLETEERLQALEERLGIQEAL